MNAEELKLKLKELLGDQIEFNRDFDRYVNELGNQSQNLLEWCKILAQGGIRPIPSPKLKDSILFIKKIGSTNRCIVINLMNMEFKEVHLGDHAYYDKLRKILGIKKDNQYY